MNVISLKEYAQNNRISYEAVRQQVVRYAEELGDHIIKDGRQQFLDEEAVAFLDGKRQKNPVVVYQASKDEEIERLENQNKELLIELANVQKQLLQSHLQNCQLQLEAGKVQQLEADNEAARRRAEQAEADRKSAEERARVSDQERISAEIALEQTRRESAKQIADLKKELSLEVEHATSEEQRRLAVERENEEMSNAGLMKRIFGWR